MVDFPLLCEEKPEGRCGKTPSWWQPQFFVRCRLTIVIFVRCLAHLTLQICMSSMFWWDELVVCCLYDGNMLGFLQHELQLLSIEAPCGKAKVFWWKSLATFFFRLAQDLCVCVLFQGDRPSKNSKWSFSSGSPNNFKPILLKGSYRNLCCI